VPLLRKYAWIAAIVAAYFYVVPYFPHVGANELPRVDLVKSIVEDHTLTIEKNLRRYGPTPDRAEWGGHSYSNKAPGSSFVVVPFYAAVHAVAGEQSFAFVTWLSRVVSGVVPSLLFLWLLWGFLERFAPEPEIRRLVLVAYAFGSMALTYSLLFYSHQLSAVCVGSAWIFATDVADRKRGLWALAAAGALAGAAPLVDYEAAFAVPPIAVYVLAKMWRTWPRRELVRAVAIATAAAAVPIAILLLYHYTCFGSPFRTSYAASTDYAADHAHGLLGMTYPHAEAFWGAFFAPDNGLVPLDPWLLLAIPGGVYLWRRGLRAEASLAAAVALVFVYFISSIAFWRAGWEVGPRYLTAMLPFLLPLVATTLAAWREKPLRAGLAGAAIGVGVVVYAVSAATLPSWPAIYRDPLYEVSFRVLVNGLAAPTLGSGLGLSRIVAIAPWLVLVVYTTAWAILRAYGARALAIAVVVALAIVGAFALVPHGGADQDRGFAQTVVPIVRGQ
jgi:hypothetical protein